MSDVEPAHTFDTHPPHEIPEQLVELLASINRENLKERKYEKIRSFLQHLRWWLESG